MPKSEKIKIWSISGITPPAGPALRRKWDFLPFFYYWLDQTLVIRPGSANLECWRKKTKQKKKTKKKKTRKIFRLCLWLNEECPKLLSSLGINHWRRKTIVQEKKGITVCLVSTILGTVWWPGRFQTVSRGQVLVFFYSLFVCFVALRPKSTAMVIAGRSVHLTTLFPGQAWTSG